MSREVSYENMKALEEDNDRLRETIRAFISTVMTINQRENLPEWMEYLAERINEVCEVIGEEDRVTYNPKREVIYINRK